jgi:hypothetical protein
LLAEVQAVSRPARAAAVATPASVLLIFTIAPIRQRTTPAGDPLSTVRRGRRITTVCESISDGRHVHPQQ